MIAFFSNWKNILYTGLSLFALVLLWMFRRTIVRWLTPDPEQQKASVLSDYGVSQEAIALCANRVSIAMGTNKSLSWWQGWVEDDEDVYKILSDAAAKNLNIQGIVRAYRLLYTENRDLQTDIINLIDEPYKTKILALPFFSAGQKISSAQKLQQKIELNSTPQTVAASRANEVMEM